MQSEHRQTGVLIVCGLVACLLIVGNVLLIALDKLPADSFGTLSSGVLVPLLLILLGAQHTRTSERLDKIEKNTNGNMQALIERVPTQSESPSRSAAGSAQAGQWPTERGGAARGVPPNYPFGPPY